MKIIRVSDDLHEKLKEHAGYDKRTINAEAEIILTLYFDDAEGGLTSEKVAANRRSEAHMVKDHIVAEGKALGILPEKKSAEATPRPSLVVAAPSKGEELPCCGKSKPCQHWSYNGAEGTWVNTISGRIKEVA